MKKKKPAIAAVLNFSLPGWGVVYLGSPIMTVTGIALFICLLLNSIADLNATGGNETLAIVSGVGTLLALAAISWESQTYSIVLPDRKARALQGHDRDQISPLGL